MNVGFFYSGLSLISGSEFDANVRDEQIRDNFNKYNYACAYKMWMAMRMLLSRGRWLVDGEERSFAVMAMSFLSWRSPS